MSFESTQSLRSAPAHRIACAALCTAALSLLAAGAHAKDAFIDEKVVVNYADLDLSQPQDARTLYSRLRNASNKVCGWYNVRDLRVRIQRQICYETALEEAVADVNHAAITQLHDTDRRIRVAQRK